MAQRVKDLVLPLLWHGFDPWPGNVCVPWYDKKKKKKKKERKKMRVSEQCALMMGRHVCQVGAPHAPEASGITKRISIKPAGVRKACSTAGGKAAMGPFGNDTCHFCLDPLSKIWSQVHTYLWRMQGRHPDLCQERREWV